MKIIDLASWPRRAQFELYREIDIPYFSVTAPVEVRGLKRAAKAVGTTISITLVYLLSRAANQIPEFRTRIRGDQVIEHEVVHPSITVLAESERLSFCTIPFSPDFATFRATSKAYIEQARVEPSLKDPPGKDDMLFMTSIPWVAFSGISHPVPLDPPDSVPRIAWGKISDKGDGHIMPLSVQCHHAVMDGLHVGRFFETVEGLLIDPQESLSNH